jgi:hypothetical protein
MPSKAVSLTAYAALNSYTVKFFANNGTDATTTQKFNYGETKNLTACSFSYTGYSFYGWRKDSGTSRAYTDQASVSNLTSTHDAVINLHAMWNVKKVKVIFHKNEPGATTDTNRSQTFTWG